LFPEHSPTAHVVPVNKELEIGDQEMKIVSDSLIGKVIRPFISEKKQRKKKTRSKPNYLLNCRK
jgi:hypothetical protein